MVLSEQRRRLKAAFEEVKMHRLESKRQFEKLICLNGEEKCKIEQLLTRLDVQEGVKL